MRHKTIRSIVLVLLFLVVTTTVSSGAEKLSEEQKIKHVLNRLGFGARPGDVERVRKLGIREYIEQQLRPESIRDSLVENRVAPFTSLKLSPEEVFEQYPDPQQLARELGMRPNQQQGNQPNPEATRAQTQQYVRQYMMNNMLQRPQQLLQELVANKIVRGVYSERQLQEVMADFWFNHFNVYWDKGADRWLTTDFEVNAIRPHTLGKFKDLLLATAQNPAMLFYLDNHLSSVPAPAVEAGQRRRNNNANPNANALRNRRAGINENYARELMELHTMGVDGGYTQKDVTEVARALTGWTIDQPRMNASFVFRPQMHDRGEKIVLGHKISGNGGMEDGLKVIDILVHHPSTARFISTKLVRRFVSDNPPQSLITKVAATYTETDGDIRQMLRTIFFSEEFMSEEAYGQKMKTPFEYVVSAIRALDGETAGGQQLARAITQMGQPLYQFQAPTGFPDRADYWMSDGGLIARLNFAVTLGSGRIPDTRISLNEFKDAQAAALFLGSPDFQKR
jgi:uncharacterized protein (DUF1800 family)